MLVIFNTGERLLIPSRANILDAYNDARKRAGDYYGFRVTPYQGECKLENPGIGGLVKASVTVYVHLEFETFIPRHYLDAPLPFPRRFLKTKEHVWSLFDLLVDYLPIRNKHIIGLVVEFVY